MLSEAKHLSFDRAPKVWRFFAALRMTSSAVVLFATLASAALPAWAQGVPDDLLVIKAGRVITVSGEEFAPGVIVVEEGRITGVGNGIEYPPSARVIDARGETVMPGFIHPRSRHGLPPYRRDGVHGDWKAPAEVYLSQIRFEDLLAAGYTAVCFVPDGTDIPGVSTVYRTAGPEDERLLLEDAYLRVNPEWADDGKGNLRDAFKKAADEIEKVKKAREEWEKEQKEKAEKEKEKEKSEPPKEEKKEDGGETDGSAPTSQAKLPPEQVPAETKEEDFKPPTIDPAYQPLVDLIQMKEGVRLLVELFKASDLHHLDDVLGKYEGITPVLYLGTSRQTDYHHIVDELGERKAEVILYPWIHFLPETRTRYNLIKELSAAGCGVSVAPAWGDEREEYLHIRERLADLVRAGLPRNDAIKSLTLHPANAIGLGKRLGSIEKEKDADLVFLDGDPIDPHSKVTRVMILGEFAWTEDHGGQGARPSRHAGVGSR